MEFYFYLGLSLGVLGFLGPWNLQEWGPGAESDLLLKLGQASSWLSPEACRSPDLVNNRSVEFHISALHTMLIVCLVLLGAP